MTFIIFKTNVERPSIKSLFRLLISCRDNADADEEDGLAKQNGPNHNLQTLTQALASVQVHVTLPPLLEHGH